MTDCVSVCEALQMTPKGQLRYDRYWHQEGRAEGILQEIGEKLNELKITPNDALYDECDYVLSAPYYTSSPESDTHTSPSEAAECRRPPRLNVSPELVQTELAIEHYEQNRIQKVQEKMKDWQEMLEHHFNSQFLKMQKKMNAMKIRQLEEQAKAERLKQEYELMLREIEEKKQQELKEQSRMTVKRLSEKMRNADLQYKAQQEELQRKHKLQEALKTKLGLCLKAICPLLEQSEQAIALYRNNEQLLQKCQEWQTHLSQLKQRVEQCTELTEREVQNAETLKTEAQALLQDIIDNIEQVSAKPDISKKKKEEQSSDATKQDQTRMSAPSPTKSESQQPSSENKEAVEEIGALNLCVDSAALREYLELKAFHEKVEKAYQPLISDPQLKKYKFDLQKAINTPVNALSAYSGSHLRDKYERLLAVLSGQTVEVGEKRVNCKQHPQAIFYCMDLLAKKIVTQSEGQVASKFETAFPVATVAAGLWGKFPEFGRLMLYHFYQRCPYLVPYYIPRLEGQSEEEHYKELGYLYNDDVIEKQDKFLKRMSGYMRLYAAILQSSPPPGTNSTNPHGIQYGWRWLSRVLNLQARPDITATLLFDFLEVAGHAMEQAYGKQFQKLLHALCKDFFPQIKKITPVSGGGPLTRLEDFLQKVVRQRKIQPPEGILKSNFWYT